MRSDAEKIYTGAIKANLPDNCVREGLRTFSLPRGRLIVVSVGKAAWRMAECAQRIITRELFGKVDTGIVITKYSHSEGQIHGFEIYEAAHPVPDEAGVFATEHVLSATEGLTADDCVLFLVSGGGSALFESPVCSISELREITDFLLASGADIKEINAVRKRLSKVKGGRFAEHIFPARVHTVALSDVLGNRLDTIASGPTVADMTTCGEVFEIVEKYKLPISDSVRDVLMRETPKTLTNESHFVGGSVGELCLAAKREAELLGYKAEILTDSETGEAREVGARLARLALEKCDTDTPLAFIIGGETVVHLQGSGLGGRNQETALAACAIIAGNRNIAVFSVGSDGTDGPTDAAGGYVDGESYVKMTREGLEPLRMLDNNDSYNALLSVGGLIKTGPTGTNVNDIAVALVRVLTPYEPDTNRRFSNLERVLNFGVNNT